MKNEIIAGIVIVVAGKIIEVLYLYLSKQSKKKKARRQIYPALINTKFYSWSHSISGMLVLISFMAFVAIEGEVRWLFATISTFCVAIMTLSHNFLVEKVEDENKKITNNNSK